MSLARKELLNGVDELISRRMIPESLDNSNSDSDSSDSESSTSESSDSEMLTSHDTELEDLILMKAALESNRYLAPSRMQGET